MTQLEFLNNHVKDGYIKITSKRLGGGFTCGNTVYFIQEGDALPRNTSLEKAYARLENYLKTNLKI